MPLLYYAVTEVGFVLRRSSRRGAGGSYAQPNAQMEMGEDKSFLAMVFGTAASVGLLVPSRPGTRLLLRLSHVELQGKNQ